MSATPNALPRRGTRWRMRRALLATTSLAILFILGLCLFLDLSLGEVSDKTNELEARRSIESVKGAVAASTKSVTSVTLDNSIWDEAVTKAYAARLDQAWFDQTWGTVSGTGENYDAAFLVDDHFSLLIGYVEGKPLLHPTGPRQGTAEGGANRAGIARRPETAGVRRLLSGHLRFP